MAGKNEPWLWGRFEEVVRSLLDEAAKRSDDGTHFVRCPECNLEDSA